LNQIQYIEYHANRFEKYPGTPFLQDGIVKGLAVRDESGRLKRAAGLHKSSQSSDLHSDILQFQSGLKDMRATKSIQFQEITA